MGAAPMTDLERLLKLASLVADDGFASSCKGVSEYREALLCTVVSLLGFTPEFIEQRRALQIRRRQGAPAAQCLGDAVRQGQA